MVSSGVVAGPGPKSFRSGCEVLPRAYGRSRRMRPGVPRGRCRRAPLPRRLRRASSGRWACCVVCGARVVVTPGAPCLALGEEKIRRLSLQKQLGVELKIWFDLLSVKSATARALLRQSPALYLPRLDPRLHRQPGAHICCLGRRKEGQCGDASLPAHWDYFYIFFYFVPLGECPGQSSFSSPSNVGCAL